MRLDKDVIVIGGGAAGLMCAIEAGKRGRSVLVLERSEKIGKKILISGGGRCNFTNRDASPRNFVSRNPHFCKSALARFTPQDFISLVEKYGVAYHEKKLGQLFCDLSSDEIMHLLEEECKAAKVEVRVNCNVSKIERNDHFQTHVNDEILSSRSLVIATGGRSIPKMGATSFGYETAKHFGLGIVTTRPALVPFTWDSHDLKIYGELAGVSLDAIVRCGNKEFRENILFTHKGLSGPAILQISSYWQNRHPIFIDLLPEKDVMDELAQARKSGIGLVGALSKHLPRRFVQIWCEQNVPAKPMSHCTGKDLKAISDCLHRWQVTPNGTEGYDKAEVTIGGVDTKDFSSQTMECKKVPALYFVGEVMDVTGHLGGYNFQWAWSSGFAAGQAV
ncbi:MAG: NAD(P)/FAD-dependent oxidoreductase [Elusimicrobia bacterium]|nr:NAD(P)/FAD-dependent oxidoreductase [Elusimicrobiota bacterium]